MGRLRVRLYDSGEAENKRQKSQRDALPQDVRKRSALPIVYLNDTGLRPKLGRARNLLFSSYRKP